MLSIKVQVNGVRIESEIKWKVDRMKLVSVCLIDQYYKVKYSNQSNLIEFTERRTCELEVSN